MLLQKVHFFIKLLYFITLSISVHSVIYICGENSKRITFHCLGTWTRKWPYYIKMIKKNLKHYNIKMLSSILAGINTMICVRGVIHTTLNNTATQFACTKSVPGLHVVDLFMSNELVRGYCSFCFWPSLFKFSFHNVHDWLLTVTINTIIVERCFM